MNRNLFSIAIKYVLFSCPIQVNNSLKPTRVFTSFRIKTIVFRAILICDTGISLSFGVAGRHCQEPGQIHCLLYNLRTKSIKVAGTEGKVGGHFCRMPPLNENTGDIVFGLVYKYRSADFIFSTFPVLSLE